ncbi:MAG: ribosome recycling factor, partial [Clostridiales bacterium]
MIKDCLTKAEEKMDKTAEALKRDFSTLRAGRATPALLDKIEVDYYGTMTPLNQTSNVSSPDSRTLLIQPWDKSMLKGIEKAILASDLGLNPNNDGSVIRISIPQLTEERRKELVKVVKKKG